MVLLFVQCLLLWLVLLCSLNEKVIIPIVLYGSEFMGYGMKVTERQKLNVLEMKCGEWPVCHFWIGLGMK